MPRPGPRPYECVRRAWHSDRHQPIRGSLIQEIFRVANEVHNPTTRKNKEWLEKLPLVVLKAEEIMYSKANSEAEYMDLETLWERANDAIDTIIRRDDTPETEGDLLQPCIEAALNLGCIPRRASRSQRHSNPGCYLSSVNKEVNDLGSSMQALLPLPLPPNHLTNNQNSLSQLQSWYSTLVAPRSVGSDGSFGHKDLVPFPKFGIDPQSCPRLGRVYPLYYNYEQSPMNSQVLEGNLVTTSTCNPPSACEDGIGLLHNFFIGSKDIRAVSKTGLSIGKASENPHTNECDLSLRLGLFSPSSLDRETGWNHEVEDVGSSSSCNGSKHSDQSPSETRMPNFESSFSSSKEKCFDFFSMDSADEPLEPGSSKWSSEEEGNVLHQRVEAPKFMETTCSIVFVPSICY